MAKGFNIFCCGKYCQENPDQARHIVILDDTDKRLNMFGMYVCPDCKKRKVK